MAYKISDDCISCGACAATCPVEAISEGSAHYEIDPDKWRRLRSRLPCFGHLCSGIIVKIKEKLDEILQGRPFSLARKACPYAILVH